jgi:hypothetical protein
MVDLNLLASNLCAGTAAGISAACEQLQACAPTATYSDIADMLNICPSAIRPRVVLLLRDILAGWQQILYGAPVLMLYTSVRGDKPLSLPLPDMPPAEDVTSLAWLPLATLDSAMPFGRHAGPVSVRPGVVECAVLLMRAGETPPAPSDAWWGDLYRSVLDERSRHGRIQISSRIVVDFPAAIEIGCALLASSTATDPNQVEDTPHLFLSPRSLEWARLAGQQWRMQTLELR